MKFILSLLFLMPVPSYGVELYEIHRSVRALGMGNAFTAVAQGKDALFYNPAGLAKTTDLAWTIFDFGLGVNGQEAYDTINGLQDQATYEDKLRSVFGKSLWLGGEAISAITGPGFGASVYESFNLSADLSNPALPTFDLGLLNDFGFNGGFGFELIPGFNVGVVISRISRLGSTVPIGVETLGTVDSDDLLNQIRNQGVGYGMDLGMSMTMPTSMKPTFALTWRNVGRTSFTQDSGAARPPSTPDEMILGYSMLIDLPGLDITPAVDYRYMNRSDIQLTKKVHFGVEFAFPFIQARAGFHQGYYTLGVGANLGVLDLQVATYGVELGEYPGQHEDRRYLLEFKFELGLGVGGGKGDGRLKNGGSSKSLKQRR